MHKFLGWLRRDILGPPIVFKRPDLQGLDKLYRWKLLPRNRFFNVYLHYYVAPDEFTALHDHPFCFLALTLAGYGEESLWKVESRKPLVIKAIEKKPRIRALKPFRFRFYSGTKYCHFISKVAKNGLWTIIVHGPRYKEVCFYDLKA